MSLHIQRDNFLASDPCVDKLTFETKPQAEAARALAKLEHGNKNLEPYRCHKCDLWHLATKQPE